MQQCGNAAMQGVRFLVLVRALVPREYLGYKAKLLALFSFLLVGVRARSLAQASLIVFAR